MLLVASGLRHPSGLQASLRRAPLMLEGGIPWPELRVRLDQLPAFCVDEEDGSCAVYLDFGAAKTAGKPYATGLGVAYERAFGMANLTDGTAWGAVTIVPSSNEVALARILPGGEDIHWESGAIPLFGSYALRRRLQMGEETIPLFFAAGDAQKAIDEATPIGGTSLELRSLSLQQMIDDMLSGKLKNPSSIQFVPPAVSLRLIQEMQAEEALPPNLDARQAMLSLFDGTRDARRGRSIFPS